MLGEAGTWFEGGVSVCVCSGDESGEGSVSVRCFV